MPYLGNEVAPLVQALEGKELKIDSDGDSSIQASADDTVVFKTNSNTALKIDANGHITKPLQPAFLVTASANSNFAINTTHTVVYSTEVYDQNDDFASNTFTAPVTGKYLLSQTLYFTGISSGAVYLSCFINTSNRVYVSIVDPGTFDEGSSYHTISIAVVADMDASDTATSRYYQAGGSAISDLGADTHFSGCLLA